MRRLAVVVAAVVVVSLSLVGAAQARTPTPTPTSTPWQYPTPWPTSTPRPPADQIANFRGTTWADAHPAGGPVMAVIDDQVCGEAEFITIPCDPACTFGEYRLDVVSDKVKQGCGYEGATITFLVKSMQASQTATWHAGSSQLLPLIAGPPFAGIWGHFVGPPGLPILHAPYSEESSILIPYIDGVACGYNFSFWCSGPGCTHSTIIYSDLQRPGCGYEGASITFKLVDSQHNAIATAIEKGVWHAWDGRWPSQQELNLTLVTPGGIRIGNVGTGDSQESGGPPVAVVALGLAIAGVATFAAGAMLRRLSVQRVWERKG